MSKDLSSIISVYNWAKRVARAGMIDEQRLNRALGIVLSNDYHTGDDVNWRAAYGTTTRFCDCPDSKVRKAICKHRLAAMIEQRVREMQDNNLEAGA
jgi:hypothetical protein